mgnify:FL=1
MICRDLLSNRFMEWRQTLSIVTINIQTWDDL